MTTDELHKLHIARPFQPFTIRLGDGQALPVEHPEMLAYAPKHRTATVYRKDGSFEVVDLRHSSAKRLASINKGPRTKG